jgi:hypothetical protein
LKDDKLALFLMLGQTAAREISSLKETAPPKKELLSGTYDLSLVLPELVKKAFLAADGYRLFFIFENYIRKFVFDVLSEKDASDWWLKIPKDVRDEVERLEETEEQKMWMALNSRSKLSLTTLPQLLKIIEDSHNWKNFFEAVVRDKSLLQEARHISHIRNTICHMGEISEEELARVKQVMRDWLRVVEP